MDKVIVFDFDGVMLDSVHECYIITKIVLQEMGIDIKSDKFENQFIESRKFVLSADEYYVIAKALEDDPDIDLKNMNQGGFDKLVERFSFSKEFFEKFYEMRKRLREENKEKWIKMHRIYPNIMEAVKKLKDEYPIFVGTAKNKGAVMNIMKAFGYDDVFDEDRIISKEVSKKKAEQMKYISERFGIPFNKILFIEDMVQNALSTKAIGVNVAMVSWGYSDERQREDARKNGIPIIKNDKIYEQIKEIMDGV